ncbi:Threonine/homoserine efflux transporter RhtA [Lutibacter oricola]|uniref:Threonine/homoserine efflux transporter RhtA n=1 Tax=Lutibacter oricola TaxID=762486 RepID=A0A1H2X556_9FLAO|nr:DMT family transporter [Lutibacter oricola]SDW88020.1 Threonine/homoserine efflux transporter RhtA [Lutibacter oricola]
MSFFKTVNSGVPIAIVGIVMFSAKAIMVKLAYKYQVDTVHLLLFRMLFSVPFYMLIAFYIKPQNPEKIQKRDYLWIVLFGFIGYYLASYFDFVGLKYIKAGLERIILFIYPTLVLLISKVFFKVPISKKQLIAILITYLGVIITFWGEVQFNNSNVYLGGFFIFLSALTYASYLVGSGWLIPKFGVVPFTSYAMIVSTICVVIHYLIVDGEAIFIYPYQVYILGFLMAIVSTLIPSFLVSSAIKKMGASNFSIIGSIGPISTIILAYFFLNEKLTMLQLLGTLIVIFGVAVVSYKKRVKL